MPSKAQIVNELIEEIGRSSPEIQDKIEQAVSEVTVDLLSQNDSRFRDLQKDESITLTKDVKEFKLPYDFVSAHPISVVLDSDNEFYNEFTIIGKEAFYRKKKEGTGTPHLFGWVKYYNQHPSGPGNYLILGQAWDNSDYTLEFTYYRQPTENDTDVIHNTTILKNGVRGRYPEYFPATSQTDRVAYEAAKQHFRESVRATAPDLKMVPSRRIRRHNQLQRKVGKGL